VWCVVEKDVSEDNFASMFGVEKSASEDNLRAKKNVRDSLIDRVTERGTLT
jgi:hypothetical protein